MELNRIALVSVHDPVVNSQMCRLMTRISSEIVWQISVVIDEIVLTKSHRLGACGK
jgi:hypothetical protein